MRLMVTGGAGYIGSHAVRRLVAENHEVVVVDNLSHGYQEAVDKKAKFYRISVESPQVETLLREHRIEAVMHFAAFIEVGESVIAPEKYYQNNFIAAFHLLESMKRAGVSKFVFSSTAAVYGDPVRTPIDEDHPKVPINPYGQSKWMLECALKDFSKAYDFAYASLRYFNVAGASEDSSIGEAHEPESHLVPRILAAALHPEQAVKIFGTDYATRDGTCLRDYVHVEDLVEAHLLTLPHLKPRQALIYNLGSESGFSVREVIAACEKVTSKKIRFEEASRRAGDPAELIASSEKIRAELGWQRKKPDIQTIVRDAWNWHLSHPRGYR